MNPSQSTWASAGGGMSLSLVLAWVLSLFHITMPPDVAAAAGALIAAGIGYFFDGGQASHTVKVMLANAVASQGGAGGPPPSQGGFARPAMLCLIALAGFPILAALPACSTFQEVQKLPLDRRIQLAYDSHAEVTRDVTAALQAGQISKGAASNYLQLAEGSRKVLDEAKALASTDLSSAEAQLALATDLLTRLQSSLIAKGAK